jgi:hypothetical protein
LAIQYRAIRAAATALIVAAAVGAGGMAGMTSALAADPATVALTGTLIDGGGAPLAGIHLVIDETLPPNGGNAAFQVTTAADGSFAADVHAWGTVDAPATLTVTARDETVVLESENCSRTWSVAIDPDQAVTLAGAALDPLTLTATTALVGEVCGTVASPPPTIATSPPTIATSPPNTTGGGRPQVTPPPTDTFELPAASEPDRLGPALMIGFVVGLLASAAVLLSRPGARRRD